MDDIIKMLDHEDEDQRYYAVQEVVDSNIDDKAIHLINRLIVEESEFIRDSIVSSLKSVDCSTAYNLIFEMFTSDDAFIRNCAVSIFGYGNEGSVSFLESKVNHSDREVRKLVLDSLFNIGSKEAIAAIRKAFDDPAPNVKITAVEYLGRLNDAESVSHMIELFNKDKEPMLRSSILDSLCTVGSSEQIKLLLDGIDINEEEYKVYIPQIILLTSTVGAIEDVTAIINSLPDTSLYAEDIVAAVDKISTRVEGVCSSGIFVNKIVEIIKDQSLHTDVRVQAGECILSRDSSFFDNGFLYELGRTLVEDKDDMIYTGVSFLSKSKDKKAGELIQSIMESTEDEDLRGICADIINDE